MSTVPDSLSQLKDMGLLSDDDLSVCRQMATNDGVPMEELIDALVDQGRLTAYQAGVICNRRPGMLVIGDYVILDRLGAGGMGIVYRAYDRRMHREVAIKMLLESGQQSEEKIERFRREAIAAARMNHPNIVTAFAASEHEGYPYLVMEYVKGRDLGSLVKKGDKLPVPEAVNYMLQTAKGMEYAHSRHIIHRDLKPSNLLLATPDDSDVRPDHFSRVKILDMGLARLTQPTSDLLSPALQGQDSDGKGSDLSATGMLMGTVDYMAPEQAMDTKRADHRSDIYSLGCTLYYLLTKRPVYTGNNLLERISAHLKADIPSLKEARPEVPEELDEVFQKMVAKKPRDRYQSMTEVVEALGRINRQLNTTGPTDSFRGGDFGDGEDYAQPGSSYGGSRSGSGSQGSAPTVASGSGPMAGMPGSSFGSTMAGEEYSGTVPLHGMPLKQKLILVGLLALMASTMLVFYYRYVNRPDQVSGPGPDSNGEIVEVAPKPPPIYLPPNCQPIEGESKIQVLNVWGGKRRLYDVIALDTNLLPNLTQFPDGPAVAEKPPRGPGVIERHPGPAIAEKPKPLVRFRLVVGNDRADVRPFYIMEDKVWNGLFREFAESNPHKLDEETVWTSTAPDRVPVFNVDLMEAYWCARWMGGKLPSAREWDTAAGFYLSEDEREKQIKGPYISPVDPDEKPNVRVDWDFKEPFESIEPVSMDDPETDDISPYNVRYMAGNGEEFTRSTITSDLTSSKEFKSPQTDVVFRGKRYEDPSQKPLTYAVMQERLTLQNNSGWGQGRKANSQVSFRVVLPIPREREQQEDEEK